MADPRTFISFDFDHDEEPCRLFRGQATSKSPTPFTIHDWSSKSALPQSQWEALIADKIGRCAMLIVLVGKHTHSATGVKKEIAMATAKDVPFRGVYVDGANTATSLPTGLARAKTISWTWDGVAAAIDAMKSEGKNA